MSTLTSWLSDYEKSFEVLKPARKLNWLPHLGTVKLELELQDRTLEFSVSPVHASIIHCFEENGAFYQLTGSYHCRLLLVVNVK